MNKTSSDIHSLLGTFKDPILKLLGKAPASQDGEQRILACDLGKTKAVLLEMIKSTSGIKISQFEKFSRPSDDSKLSQILADCVQKFGTPSPKVRLSVKGQGVVVRFIQFPKMSPDELRSALTYETEKYIPFKAEDVIIDYHVLDDEVSARSEKMQNLILVAVKRDEIYKLVQTFQSAGMSVELVDVDAFAFYNCLEFYHPEDCGGAVAILDIGTDVSTLIVAHKGAPRFIRDISYGGADLVKKLKRKLGMTDQQAAEQLEAQKEPSPEAAIVLREAVKSLISDFRVSLDYYLDQVASSEPVKKLFLGGGMGYQPFVVATFKEELGIEVQSIDVASKVSFTETAVQEAVLKSQSLLPVALGLALR